MKIEEIKEMLKEDQEAGFGEILEENENSVSYYNYELAIGATMTFRGDAICTREELMNLIITKDDVWTKEKVADVIIAAYGDTLADAMCVVRAIILIDNNKDLDDACRNLFPDDNWEESFSSEDIDENMVGQNIYDYQTPIIHLGNIRKNSDDEEMYMDGVGCTIIHELRHCMLDCNPILSEEEYAVELGKEENVEDFCRRQWDRVRADFVIQ